MTVNPAEAPNIPPGPRRALSRRKKWVLRLIVLVLLVPVVEALAWVGLVFSDKEHHFSFDDLRVAQHQLADTGLASNDALEVIHPYIGWVINPEIHRVVRVADYTVPINRFGFVDNGPTLLKRSPERCIVGIVGGSVAMQMGIAGEQALRRRLNQDPRLAGKKIELVRLAIGGMKQPQQLMALSYLLSLGGELDVLINVDGFNDVALPTCENDVEGVFAAYPHSWNALTSQIVDPRRYAESFGLLELRGRRQAAARAMIESPIAFSPMRNLIWKIYDTYLARRLTSLSEELVYGKKAKDRGYAATGPPQIYKTKEGMYRQLAEIWSASSQQMDFLCRGNGIRYVHFLQPNQYVPDSKPMGSAEKQTAIKPDLCWGQAVRDTYSLLLTQGVKLHAAGVDFHDMTRLFANVSDPIYADSCCHYNQKGNDLLATAAAESILEALKKPER